ncbi:MAG TPA: hypothetical protein VGK30_11000 [Candidatus Binatia bacterium]
MLGSIGTTVVLALVLALPTGAWTANGDTPVERLTTLARGRFGTLSAAETALVRGASGRALVWVGPDADPESPANDAGRGSTWGPERAIRPELLRWIVTDPEASALVDPSGIGLAGARFGGPLDLSYAKVGKPITIVRSYVPDGIDLRAAHMQDFVLRTGVAGPVTADLAEIAGDLAVLAGTYGPVSLFRAKVAGSLDCSGSTITSGGGTAVNAVEASIGGDAVFHDGFTTDGTVDARLAHIGQSLSFHDVRFTGNDETGLNAERAVVGGALYWVQVAHGPHTQLDLENAKADALWDDAASWPAPGKLAIDGFAYTQFSGGPADAASRLAWLRLQPQDERPQPYRQLATVLRDSGRDLDATDVLIAKERVRRRDPALGAGARTWSVILDLTIGYGYRPLRALYWIGGFVLFGSLLFAWGYRARLVTPVDEAAYNAFIDSGAAPPHYPPFHPLMYALENFLPVVELHQGEYWRPNPQHRVRTRSIDLGSVPGRLLLWYLWLHILAGWALTPLLFAGLSGLVRPD